MITQVIHTIKPVSILSTALNAKLVFLNYTSFLEILIRLSLLDINSTLPGKKIHELFSIFFFYLVTDISDTFKESRKPMDTKPKTKQNYRFCRNPFYPYFYINSTGTDSDIEKCKANFKYNQFL